MSTKAEALKARNKACDKADKAYDKASKAYAKAREAYSEAIAEALKVYAEASKALPDALAEQPAQQEPVAWISEIRCIGPEYGKKRYSDLPIQSLQPGYYAHTPLYTTPQAQPAPEIAIADAYRAGVDSGIAAERKAWERVVEGFGESPANALTIRKGGVA